MSHLFRTAFSPEFIEKWTFFLKELSDYTFHDEFALVPSLSGRKTYSYLPLLNYTDKTLSETENLLQKVKGKRYQIRVLNPEHTAFQEDDPVTMRIDLDKKDVEELLSTSVSKRMRRYIKHSDCSEMTIKKGNSADIIADFYAIFSTVMHRHGTPVFGKRLFVTLSKTVSTTYYVAYNGNIPVSAAVIVDDLEISWIPWSGTHRKYMQERPGLILYWETIKDAFSKKKLIYDFGRSSYGSGTYIFKKRWGAIPVKVDILQHRPSNIYRKYRFVAPIWKKMPFPLTLWLGPKLCKRLPDL
jgi:lipid II:glycine glycyltransferase (peptidoglycan interpeptide bridge formation enzyme)